MMTKSNLFAIDIDAVLRAIAEANAGLVDRHKRLMDALRRVPPHLESDDDIERAKRFVEQLKDDASRCRAARLADTKPLNLLVKRVEAFFKTMEKEANAARDEVMAELSNAGRRRAAQARGSPQHVAPTPETVMINRETGEVLAAATPPAAPRTAPAAVITLTWHVDTVDRATVDLEALRPFLTEAALLTAARAHLKANGPHTLPGATYVEKAAPW
ncbi:MAG: hypothetical protein MUF51_10480 [Vicinamibacteria bacterium]|nr:hypothetical protein [Vicinamibacteria bacterium]